MAAWPEVQQFPHMPLQICACEGRPAHGGIKAGDGSQPSCTCHCRFAPVRDDRRMVASKLEMDREERLSKRAGRQDDEKADEEERAYRELKLKKKEKLRAKNCKMGSGGGALWA